MKLTVLAVLLCCLCEAWSATQRLANIDYVGRGYDVFYGNPQAQTSDPGFREAAVDLTYDKVRTLVLELTISPKAYQLLKQSVLDLRASGRW
jgi:hypothetical protein